jgi:hypothetical protein
VYEKRGEEKEAEASGSGGQGPSKKPRFDPSENRPSWVKSSVSDCQEGHRRPGPTSSLQIKMERAAAGSWVWTQIL